MVYSGKAFDKIKYSFIIKTSSKIRLEGNLLNVIKNIFKISIAYTLPNGKKLETF